ncbi:hypothetical protein [Novosphingobium sp. M1R2S20]|uniref:Restriction alleviation protein Lar n=1 Tax=Novosphingobium rhizovicinum TaxID=3228928 RepID=A0ABV3RD68_9SPHN
MTDQDASGAMEQAVKVCPQCDGEGGYPDGLDEDACHTECTRCGSNGWIVDLEALQSSSRSNPSEQQGDKALQHVAYFDEGEFHWMSGIAPRDCELYAAWPRKPDKALMPEGTIMEAARRVHAAHMEMKGPLAWTWEEATKSFYRSLALAALNWPVEERANAATAEQVGALKDVTVSLIAAVSLLEKGGKKAAPSDRMFGQMLKDYKASIERGRAVWRALEAGR